MLIVGQLYNEKMVNSDYVKCPCCNKGRLCDKPVGIKVSTDKKKTSLDNTDGFIILKCHKCGKKSILQFSIK